MKIFSTLLVVLTLTALLLTGCGCSNVPAEPIKPTTRPTTQSFLPFRMSVLWR